MKAKFCFIILLFFRGFLFSQNNSLKLQTNDYLDYFFNLTNNSFHIYKVTKESKQEIFYNIDITYWGMCQISENKKRIIFFEDTEDFLVHLLLVDGEQGIIKRLIDVPRNSVMDKSGQYLLMNMEDNLFQLLNLSNGKIEKTFKIQLKCMNNGYYEFFSIYRAIDNSKYDYLLDFGHERLTSAKIYLNIQNEDIFVEFDDTDKKEIEMRKRKLYGEEYLGWR